MVTKTALWKLIRKELISIERSNKVVEEMMAKIKRTPQDENKER